MVPTCFKQPRLPADAGCPGSVRAFRFYFPADARLPRLLLLLLPLLALLGASQLDRAACADARHGGGGAGAPDDAAAAPHFSTSLSPAVGPDLARPATRPQPPAFSDMAGRNDARSSDSAPSGGTARSAASAADTRDDDPASVGGSAPQGRQSSGNGGGSGGRPRTGATFPTQDFSGVTFGGFPYGFGGLSVTTPGQVDDLIIRAIFNRLFNFPFYGYLSESLPNQLTRPIELLPPPLRARLDRSVVTPVGYDLLDRLSQLLITPPVNEAGALVPAGCIGPVLSLGVLGGNCSVAPPDEGNDDSGGSGGGGAVICTQPSLRLTASPLTCNLPYRSGCSVTGVSYRQAVPLGPKSGGYLGPSPGIYQAGVGLNLTRVWLGFNLQARRYLQEFGVIRWYAYLVQFLAFELNRVAVALVSANPPPGVQRAFVQNNGGGGNGGGGSGGGGGNGGGGGGGGNGGGGGGGSGGAGGGGDNGDVVVVSDPQPQTVGGDGLPAVVEILRGNGATGTGTGGGAGDGAPLAAAAAAGAPAAGAANSRAAPDAFTPPTAVPTHPLSSNATLATAAAGDLVRRWTPHRTAQAAPPPAGGGAGPNAGPDSPAGGNASDGDAAAALQDVLSRASQLAAWRGNPTLMRLLSAQLLGRADAAPGGGGGAAAAAAAPPPGSGGGGSDQYAQGTLGGTFNMRGDSPEALVGQPERDAQGRRVARGSAREDAALSGLEQDLWQQLGVASAASRGGDGGDALSAAGRGGRDAAGRDLGLPTASASAADGTAVGGGGGMRWRSSGGTQSTAAPRSSPTSSSKGTSTAAAATAATAAARAAGGRSSPATGGATGPAALPPLASALLRAAGISAGEQSVGAGLGASAAAQAPRRGSRQQRQGAAAATLLAEPGGAAGGKSTSGAKVQPDLLDWLQYEDV